MFPTDKIETGSGGFVWHNTLPDALYNQVKFHVYTTHFMTTGREWAGSEFVNHYNRLYFVKSGEAILKSKGKTLKMKAGGLYLIPAYQLNTHQSLGRLEFYWCHFQAQIDEELDLFMLFPELEEFTPEQNNNTEFLMQELTDINEAETLSSRYLSQSILMKLLQPFFEKIDGVKAKPRQVKHSSLMLAINRIHQDIANPPLIKELASLCNVSVEHFSRKFKSAFNVSPKRYILAKQISRAKQLLVSTNQNIELIADQCGFGDIYHFSKSFKQEIQLTPSEFRKTFQR